MKTPIFGKDLILMFRLLENAKTEPAKKLGLQIEHTIAVNSNADFKQTKDGALTLSSGSEVSINFSAVSSRDEINEMLYDAALNGKKIECWEVNMNKGDVAEGKFPATYFQGMLESWELPAPAEDTADVSSAMKVDGKGAKGEVTLTQEQIEEVAAAYPFSDITVQE